MCTEFCSEYVWLIASLPSALYLLQKDWMIQPASDNNRLPSNEPDTGDNPSVGPKHWSVRNEGRAGHRYSSLDRSEPAQRCPVHRLGRICSTRQGSPRSQMPGRMRPKMRIRSLQLWVSR